MATVGVIPTTLSTAPEREQASRSLAASITWAASKQTFYTVRFLVDRPLVDDAYRAYGYFRWVDDCLDRDGLDRAGRMAFVARQQALIARCYRGDWPRQLAHDEEALLVDLIRGSGEQHTGLRSYIDNMMAVMAFDAGRRGRLVSRRELNDYTRWLATAVTDALHHFIGHNCRSPQDSARYLAASGAHIAHMLRDTCEDLEAGYFNIPRETLEAHQIDPRDVWSRPYRAWVKSRVQLAQAHFRAGRDYLARVENGRCRLAGYAYIARFEGVLAAIERDGYRLRADYTAQRGLSRGLRVSWSALSPAHAPHLHTNPTNAMLAR